MIRRHKYTVTKTKIKLGEKKGRSPLYYFSCDAQGRQLLKSNAELRGKITAHGLNAVAADLSVPAEIRTLNVPSIDSAVGERLSRYLNVRSATAVGWQSSNMLIVTRFGETTQLHRVSQPMGFREQLTFFSEPIRGISIPKKGAEQQVIISKDSGGSEFYQLHMQLHCVPY